MDQFDDLMKTVVCEQEKQKNIVEQINKIEFPYRNILYKAYIQNKKLVNIASEMGYEYKYTCKLHGEALNKFDNTTKSV